ncbi:putative Actinobacterial holin-X, holin superfamily III [Antarctobacter heliothermus]|uniref:Putative Actinobacterial holin-X, holin superfamily III n=1 Tax=Antarctobacter heliothermus TaxID=74033 RepID=A0A222DXT0_9RHOB|nr:phage holin family protein [Antarctobacter heliothermus]ASP18774.1 putative Actinobacterial holin-X, holin superfamily III [Antarctobacter heliothermus]
MPGPDLRDAPRLLSEVALRVTSLAQSEFRLAKAEMAQSLSHASTGIAFFGAAAVLAIVGLNVLASGVVVWLAAQGLTAVQAAGAAGGALLVVAIGLVWAGRRRVNAKKLTPKRSLNNMKRDLETLRETRRG